MKVLITLTVILVMFENGNTKQADNKSKLIAVLSQMNPIVNQKLVDVHPNLKSTVQNLTSVNIDFCYDSSVGGNNKKVNIFKENIREIVKNFFENDPETFLHLQKLNLQKRIKIFIDNLAKLTKLIENCTVKKSQNLSYLPVKLGVTSLAFFTDEEKEAMLNNDLLTKAPTSVTVNQKDHPDCSVHPLPGEPELPNEFNWVDRKKVSNVYSQLSCGSCYVFSTVSALESQYMIVNNLTVAPHFSVQAVLNCMENGCNGGSLYQPLEHFIKFGVTEDRNEPYAIQQIEDCHHDYKVTVKANYYCFPESEDGIFTEEQMQRYLLRHGPLAVAISASSPEFQNLKNSAFNGYCSKKLSHAILLVGWNQTHFILKNSW
ncbi:hypothetical protein TYRP_004419, partial [Tyrophagus putrescentiae]